MGARSRFFLPFYVGWVERSETQQSLVQVWFRSTGQTYNHA